MANTISEYIDLICTLNTTQMEVLTTEWEFYIHSRIGRYYNQHDAVHLKLVEMGLLSYEVSKVNGIYYKPPGNLGNRQAARLLFRCLVKLARGKEDDYLQLLEAAGMV